MPRTSLIIARQECVSYLEFVKKYTMIELTYLRKILTYEMILVFFLLMLNYFFY